MKCPAPGCNVEDDVLKIAVHIIVSDDQSHKTLSPETITAALRSLDNVI